jgi:hypothetical protein
MNTVHNNSFYFLRLHHPVIYIQVSQVFFSLQIYTFEMDPAFPARQNLLYAAVKQRGGHMRTHEKQRLKNVWIFNPLAPEFYI